MADRGLNGNSSLAYQGVRPTTPPNLVIHPRVPTVNDYKEFCIGDIWINNAGRLLTPPTFPGPGDVYMLTSIARNIATWIPMVGGLMSLSGDVGGHVFGDGTSNIRLRSLISNLLITGSPVFHEVVFESAGGGALAETFTTDDTNVVVPSIAGNINVFGAGGVTTTGAGSTITINGGGAGTFPTDNGNAVQAAGTLNIKAQTATLGCGSSVLFSAPGSSNTVQLDVTDSNGNTIIGNDSGNLLIAGTNNTGIGKSVFQALSTGAENTVIGENTGSTITTGIGNVMIGKDSGSLMTGDENGNIFIMFEGVPGKNGFVAIRPGNTGIFAHNFPGSDATTVNGGNYFIGGGNLTLTNSGANASNNGFGAGSLQDLTTGNRNDAIGAWALSKLTTGTSNIALGHSAGTDTALDTGLTTGTDNILIGYTAGHHYTGAESNNIILGNIGGIVGESNTTRIAGIRGVTTNVADAIPVLIDSTSQLGTVSSSIRYKQNVEDMESSEVLNLRPVTFEYKKHPGHQQFGLIAEEVEEVMPRLVVYDEDGLPETVKYHEMPAILLNELQKLVKRVEQLEEKLLKYEQL